MAEEPAVALYIHIPFCLAKCNYCDFNSYAHLDDLYEDYTAALVQDMSLADPRAIRTVYIGGGTPTVLPLSCLAQVFEAIETVFSTGLTTEVTVEANPGTVTREKLEGLRSLGANRLSLGMQSFADDELRLLGRIHNASDALQAFEAARAAGFDNLSLDLLYGLPGQSLLSWQTALERALALYPDHLSLYSLTIEDDTPLACSISRGQLQPPDPDLAADMYELAQEMLAGAGFSHYEISNWARHPESICQHNSIYWCNEPYLGLGAGAHSWLGGRRWSNLRRPEEYIRQVLDGRHPTAMQEAISPALEMAETMILGLRLLDEGVSFARFQARFGQDLRVCFANQLEELGRLGLIRISDERVVLSDRGHLLGNQVFLRFVGNDSRNGLAVGPNSVAQGEAND